MSTVNFLIMLRHPQLDDRQLQAEAMQLLDGLKPQVESADLVEEQQAPEGAKAFGAGVALGMLKAVADPKNISRVVSFLKTYLINNPQLELEITVSGNTFKAKANTIDELERLAQIAPKALGE